MPCQAQHQCAGAPQNLCEKKKRGEGGGTEQRKRPLAEALAWLFFSLDVMRGSRMRRRAAGCLGELHTWRTRERRKTQIKRERGRVSEGDGVAKGGGGGGGGQRRALKNRNGQSGREITHNQK